MAADNRGRVYTRGTVGRRVPAQSPPMTEKQKAIEALRFAGKFIFISLIVIATLWIVGQSFQYSLLAGYVSLCGLTLFLYLYAHRWIAWLPGILPFGVLNSYLSLVSQRSHAGRPISPNESLIILMFLIYYAVGTAVSSAYADIRIYWFDRIAFLLYLACILWPVFVSITLPRSNLTQQVFWSVLIGLLAIVTSYGVNRYLTREADSRSTK